MCSSIVAQALTLRRGVALLAGQRYLLPLHGRVDPRVGLQEVHPRAHAHGA